MKFLQYLILLTFIQVLGPACTREFTNVKTVPMSAITVVNAVINSNPLIADFSGADSVAAYYYTSQQIGYGTSWEYSVSSNKVPIVVYQISDTNTALYKNDLMLQASTSYSLFLSGPDTTHIDTLITQDHAPYHSNSDSTVGIRFVNLAPGNNPISVDVQGNSAGSEASKLPYQSITNFKLYPAPLNITQYIFEIRDDASGDLLTTFTYNVVPFQNITIVINGINGGLGNNSLGAFIVNNF